MDRLSNPKLPNVTAASVPTPGAGMIVVFSEAGKLKQKDSAGTVTDLTATSAVTGTKISAMVAAASVVDTQEIPVNEAGVSKKITPAQIKTFVKTETVVALTDAASITTDAASANYFTVLFTSAVGATRTLANPTGMVDRQEAIWEFTQDPTGGRALTLGTAFVIPTGATFALSTAPNAKDFMVCRYVAATLKWYVLGFIKF